MKVVKFKTLRDIIDEVVFTNFQQFDGEPDEIPDPDDPEFDAKSERYAAPFRALLEPLADDLGHITVEQLRIAEQKYQTTVQVIRQALFGANNPKELKT